MEVFKTRHEWSKYRSGLTQSLGFVPTMGALHEGHASLVEKSVKENPHC
ncbi:MAG: pantoate--beta-alanine ligase, partial [Bacteroidota bacterium]